MKTIEIFGEKEKSRQYEHIREGCRGIVIRDRKILLSYYRAEDQYLIPGGGIEPGEDLTECCKRELAEETGYIVHPHTHYLTIEEYYHKYYFKSHYFISDCVGECEQKLTENEKRAGLEPVWIDFDEAISIFSTYGSYEKINEIRYGAYYREYLALKEIP